MIIAALLLLSLGVTVIYSSSPTLAIQQAIFGVIGLFFYFFLRSFDYRYLKSLIIPAYVVTIIFLLVTLFLGFETRGSVRWIPIGPFNFQPSEFAKPVIILLLANFWSKKMPSWKNIFLSFAIVSPIFLLVYRQPDLGTTLTLVFIWFVLFISSQASLFKILSLVLSGLASIIPGWYFLQEYQKQRLISFLSPTQDPQGIGFHVIQSTIAVGSGQLMGRGIGRGTQSRLQFLPEFRTDFIFAFIAEELGFLGSVIVLVIYGIMFFLLFRLLSKTGDRFGELIIVGVMGMLFFQIFINIGMNVGLLPITGITLPLLSYGGSSVVTVLLSFGLLASVARFGARKQEMDTFSLT